MPRGNGTGPAGMGPMTGSAAGFCAGFTTPRFANPASGRSQGCGRGNGGGLGRGRRMGGVGRGFRNQFLATDLPRAICPGAESAPALDEKQILTNQAKSLQAQVEEIQKRLKALDGE